METSKETWITWKKKARRGGSKLSKLYLERYKASGLFLLHIYKV